ncbi:MAG: glycosyltransferase family 2 protein [Opitutales bacterium]
MAEPDLSIVIPFFNEAENVADVLAEVRACLPDAEIIAVDDGSTDGTWAAITARYDVLGLRFASNQGQSAATYFGLREAKGAYCGTMDGDGQNDPSDFPKLRAALEGKPRTVAVGRRARRQDRWHRVAASRIANAVRSAFLHDGVSDTGCSLKVFPREAVDLLVPFNGLHRFLPPIFRHAGYAIVEVDVNHRPRARGVSKYTTWDRALRGLYDLVGVGWLLQRKLLQPNLTCRQPSAGLETRTEPLVMAETPRSSDSIGSRG